MCPDVRADIYLPGMLHGKVLRSPHAHTHIKSIDTSAALALPGVKAVITGQDLPSNSHYEDCLSRSTEEDYWRPRTR